MIFFETAARIGAALADLSAVLGERRIVIARELTKLHEEVLSGTPGALQAVIATRGGLKGELCLLVEPADTSAERGDPAEIDAALIAALADASVSQAAAAIARRYGLARQDVYRRAIALQRGVIADPEER